jgi:hypothetical protein
MKHITRATARIREKTNATRKWTQVTQKRLENNIKTDLNRHTKCGCQLETVSRRHLPVVTRIQSKVSPCEICGGRTNTGRGSPPSTLVFPCQWHSTGAPCSSIHLPEVLSSQQITVPLNDALQQSTGLRCWQVYCSSAAISATSQNAFYAIQHNRYPVSVKHLWLHCDSTDHQTPMSVSHYLIYSHNSIIPVTVCNAVTFCPYTALTDWFL